MDEKEKGFKEFVKGILPNVPEEILDSAVEKAVKDIEKQKKSPAKSSEELMKDFLLIRGKFMLNTIHSNMIKATSALWDEEGSQNSKSIHKAERLVETATNNIDDFMADYDKILEEFPELKTTLIDLLELYRHTSKLVSFSRKKFEMEKMKPTTFPEDL